MSRPNQEVGSKYGAPMGRHCGPVDPDTDARFNLMKVRLDAGGYDPGGAYWGHGGPLYYFEASDGTASGYLRAPSRASAKLKVLEQCPAAKFYR